MGSDGDGPCHGHAYDEAKRAEQIGNCERQCENEQMAMSFH